jgi:hypothetical protein
LNGPLIIGNVRVVLRFGAFLDILQVAIGTLNASREAAGVEARQRRLGDGAVHLDDVSRKARPSHAVSARGGATLARAITFVEMFRFRPHPPREIRGSAIDAPRQQRDKRDCVRCVQQKELSYFISTFVS